LPEFARNALEALREPLESGLVRLSRAKRTYEFPAQFQLVAAMNPCPCGYFNDKSRDCQCTPPMIQRYVAKVSGPLLDRIDIHIEVPAVQYKELRGGAAAEGSAEIRERVMRARERQQARFRQNGEKIFANAQMATRQIRAYCGLGPDAERLLERAMQQQGLSARAHDRILKVARTIADLEAAPTIAVKHIAEAIQYRTLDRSYWA
jgi:magnesium chelatase family protein